MLTGLNMTDGSSSAFSSPASIRRRLRSDDFIGRALRFASEDPIDPILMELATIFDRVEDTLSKSQPINSEDFIHAVLLESPRFVSEAQTARQRYHRLHAMVRFLTFVLVPRVEAQGDEYLSSRLEGLRNQLNDLETVSIEYGPANPRMETIYDGLMELASLLGLIHPEEF